MKFVRTYKRDENTHILGHRDLYPEKCGDCPEIIWSMYCVRKKTFVNPKELYEKCPLPNYPVI